MTKCHVKTQKIGNADCGTIPYQADMFLFFLSKVANNGRS